MDTILVNQLPVRTWNRLGVNETALPWDQAASRELEQTHIAAKAGGQETVRLSVQGEGEYSEKSVVVDAADGSRVTVYEDLRSRQHLLVRTQMKVGPGAKVRLVQLLGTEQDAVLRNEVSGTCQQEGSVELLQVLLGRGDVYTDSRFVLKGDGSALTADMGYLGQARQVLDMNLVVDHYGKKTASRIDASGALKDAAKKIFRGTIDFKTGSSDSAGSEQETVLMLGEDVVNKTVPLILCAEENVVGNHGATIGELDDDTLFYFESRGIDRQTAENILARASIERLARAVGDREIEEKIINGLNEEL